MLELEKLYSERSFQEGRIYFHYGNYPYLFKFLVEDEKRNYSFGNPDENLVCACLSYDLDDLFHIVYNAKKAGYYLLNGNSNLNSPERLKHPIKLATTLTDLFECDNFPELLIDKNDSEYNRYMEESFHQYESEIVESIPTSIFPNRDLRLLYKEKYPGGYFTDHKEHNPEKLREFTERVNLKQYIDLNAFFQTRPHAETFLGVIDAANKENIEAKYLYVEFYQSGYQGLVDISDLADGTLAMFLKYGIFYNKVDVPERIYKILE